MGRPEASTFPFPEQIDGNVRLRDTNDETFKVKPSMRWLPFLG